MYGDGRRTRFHDYWLMCCSDGRTRFHDGHMEDEGCEDGGVEKDKPKSKKEEKKKGRRTAKDNF